MKFELDSEVNGVNLDVDSEGFVLGMEFINADDFPGFIERRGGEADISERVEDVKGFDIAPR
jgi:hypothetical protein